MKAFISTSLALALCLSMAACSSRNSSSSSSSSSSVPPPVSSSSSSMVSSSEPSSSGIKEDMEEIGEDISDTASDMVSDVESAVTPTMSTDFEEIGALASTQVPWGPGVIVDPETNRTTEPELHQQEYGDFGAWFIAPEGCGKLYLTFDEGYENGYTPQILDVLKEKNAKAVFFVTMPFVKTCPDLVRRMIDEGHVVGNHTNRHLNPTKVSLEEACQDIMDLHEYVKENFNYEMYLYRPPEGAFSQQPLAMAQQLGYQTVLWSFAYSDWNVDDQPSYDTALARTTKFIHEGGIYLLHAVSKTNTEILPALIDEIRARGLELAAWDLPPADELSHG